MSEKSSAFESALGRVRGLGAARDGVHHWWVQRVTAIALIPLGLWFVLGVVGRMGASHAEAVAWVGSPLNATLMALTVTALFYHAYLGLQTVIEDYIHGELAKMGSLLVIAFASVFFAVLAIFSILRVALGGV